MSNEGHQTTACLECGCRNGWHLSPCEAGRLRVEEVAAVREQLQAGNALVAAAAAQRGVKVHPRIAQAKEARHG